MDLRVVKGPQMNTDGTDNHRLFGCSTCVIVALSEGHRRMHEVMVKPARRVVRMVQMALMMVRHWSDVSLLMVFYFKLIVLIGGCHGLWLFRMAVGYASLGEACPKTLLHLSNCHAERSEASEYIHFSRTDFSLRSK